MQNCFKAPTDLEYDVYVLRIGHRPQRDKRITTHVGLVAWSFGARGIFIDSKDENLKKKFDDLKNRWGGRYFTVVTGVDAVKFTEEWKMSGSCVIHLTMYGLPVDDVINDIKAKCRKLLVIVGAEKVPRIFYELADYNVAIGNLPHSEVSALALFLDVLWNGRERRLCFEDAKIYIVPTARSKRVAEVRSND